MKKISSFSGIRFFWALAVVVCHIHSLYQAYYPPELVFLGNGGFAVTCFFVLSGFLICMHYGDSLPQETGLLRRGFAFSKAHAAKWYLVYLISSLPAFLLSLYVAYWHGFSGICKLLLRTLANLLLVQAWIPTREYSLNAAAWYLSCLSALYLLAPALLKLNRKIREKPWACCAGIVFCLLAAYLLSDFINGALYYHPIYRIFQFSIGILLYDLIGSRYSNRRSPWQWAALLPVFFAYTLFAVSLESVVQALGAIICIGVFYCFDSGFFAGRPLQRLGECSLEMYLLHFPIVIYGKPILGRVPALAEHPFLQQGILLLCSLGAAYWYHYRLSQLPWLKKLSGKIQMLFGAAAQS